jgi:hypothetical protein
MRTVLALGRSRPPRICSKVVLPEPDAPTIATLSPRMMRTESPSITRSVAAPSRNSRMSPSASSTGTPPVGAGSAAAPVVTTDP